MAQAQLSSKSKKKEPDRYGRLMARWRWIAQVPVLSEAGGCGRVTSIDLDRNENALRLDGWWSFRPAAGGALADEPGRARSGTQGAARVSGTDVNSSSTNRSADRTAVRVHDMGGGT